MKINNSKGNFQNPSMKLEVLALYLLIIVTNLYCRKNIWDKKFSVFGSVTA